MAEHRKKIEIGNDFWKKFLFNNPNHSHKIAVCIKKIKVFNKKKLPMSAKINVISRRAAAVNNLVINKKPLF